MITARRVYVFPPAASVLGAVLVALAAVYSPLAGLALLGLLAVALLLLNQAAAIPLLFVASALNRFGVQWGDARIRLDFVVVLLLSVTVTNRIGVRTLRLQSMRSPLVAPLLAYIGTNLFSTLLFATEKTRGLKLDAEIVTAGLCYLVIIALIATGVDLARCVKTLWVVTVGEAIIALCLLALYVVHLTSYGVQLADLPQAYGTQWEANIFGSFLLGNFFVLLGDYLQHNRSLPRTAGLILVVLGILASLTRTVWLGLIVGMMVLIVAMMRTRGRATGLVAILLSVPVFVLLGLLVGSATPLAGRLTDIVNLHSSSASGRLILFQQATYDIRRHLLFGMGTGSFNWGAVPGLPHPWLPNLLLLTLHDTGVLGFGALLWLFTAFYVMTWKALSSRTQVSPLIAGSIASATALIIAFQTTSGFWFTYPWIVLAVGSAAVRLNKEKI